MAAPLAGRGKCRRSSQWIIIIYFLKNERKLLNIAIRENYGKIFGNQSLNTHRWNFLDNFHLINLDKQNRLFESKILHDFPQAVYPMRTYRILYFFAQNESSKLQLSGNLNFIQIGYDLDGYMRAYRESSKFLFEFLKSAAIWRNCDEN